MRINKEKIKKIGKLDLKNDLKGLLKDIRQQNRDTLEQRLYDLTAAFNITKEAYSSPDLEMCLKSLINKISDLMSVENISLMLMDREKGNLVVKLAKGMDKEIVKEAKVKVGEGVSGWIAKTGEPLLINDITKDKRFTNRADKYYTNSLLSVPLKVKNKVIGVINVNNKISRDVFRKEDLNILKTVSDMAAVAIESSRIKGEAKALEKLRGDFISNVSHELRTPLMTIKESVVLLLDGIAGNINDDQKKFLELAKNNIERLARLVDGLLDLARIDSGGGMKRSLFDIVHTIETTAASLSPLARKNGNVIVCQLPSSEIKIWGDADKLAQVVTNLIDNAIKYNKPDGKVEVVLAEHSETITISVSDNGVGIPPEDTAKIFERFYRINSPNKSKIKGAGLGLFITNEIVAMHCGKITVKSELNKGSTFIVTLPKNLRGNPR